SRRLRQSRRYIGTSQRPKLSQLSQLVKRPGGTREALSRSRQSRRLRQSRRYIGTSQRPKLSKVSQLDKRPRGTRVARSRSRQLTGLEGLEGLGDYVDGLS